MKEKFLLKDDVIYLNCANMSPMLKSVKEAGLKALEKRANPWDIMPEDWFNDGETLRHLAAQIYQTSGDNIALVPSASYGLAVAGKNLAASTKKNILMLEDQFPSNYYVWKELELKKGFRTVIVKREKGSSWTESILKKIDDETGIITIPNCHWTDGTYIDLEQVSRAAKAVNAFLVLDLSQSLGALPINIEKIDPDFAVAVGYKWMMGPYTMGYMYVSPRWHEKGEPLEYSWLARKGSEDFASLTLYTDEYRKGARKFDMGEYSQFNSMPMCIAGLKQLLEWKVENIQSQISVFTKMIADHIRYDGMPRAGHIIGISLQNKNTDALKKRLKENKIVISFRSNTSIRVSPHLYNSKEEVEKLLEAVG